MAPSGTLGNQRAGQRFRSSKIVVERKSAMHLANRCINDDRQLILRLFHQAR